MQSSLIPGHCIIQVGGTHSHTQLIGPMTSFDSIWHNLRSRENNNRSKGCQRLFYDTISILSSLLMSFLLRLHLCCLKVNGHTTSGAGPIANNNQLELAAEAVDFYICSRRRRLNCRLSKKWLNGSLLFGFLLFCFAYKNSRQPPTEYPGFLQYSTVCALYRRLMRFRF